MGCVSSKSVDEGGRADYGSTDGEYIAKQDVTIWSYIDDGTNLRPHTIPEKTRVEVAEIRKNCIKLVICFFSGDRRKPKVVESWMWKVQRVCFEALLRPQGYQGPLGEEAVVLWRHDSGRCRETSGRHCKPRWVSLILTYIEGKA